jgi:hypothetical protein
MMVVGDEGLNLLNLYNLEESSTHPESITIDGSFRYVVTTL